MKSFLNRSLNIIVGFSYNENPKGSCVIYHNIIDVLVHDCNLEKNGIQLLVMSYWGKMGHFNLNFSRIRYL